MHTELHRRFSISTYGEQLEEQVRFGDFKPDHISHDIWEELLGDDVNNLRHMAHTHELARKFTIYEKVGDAALLRVVAITHDWGEAVVGDVALPDKEAQGHDQVEVDAYKRIASEIAPDYDLSQVPEVVWGEHELTEPFNAIEYLGYCKTGLEAGKKACMLAGGIIKIPEITRGETDLLIGGLLALNKMVELKNYPKLAKYADKYPSLQRLL